MARVLMLSYLPLYPTNGGGRVRIRQLARQLASRHAVTVICPPVGDCERDPEFDLRDCGIRGPRQLGDPRLYKRIIDVAREVRPDVVLLEYLWQGAHALVLRLAIHVPIVLDAFDVVTLRLRRAGSPLWLPVSVYERAVLRRVDRVLAVSDVDRAHLVRLGARASATAIVPNGVDTSAFRPDSAARARVRGELAVHESEKLLLFFGQLDYAPNADAVRVLAREVMPRMTGENRLIVAGRGDTRSLRELANSRIEFIGSVERIEDYVNAADAIVAPVTSGSGTRLKLLESIACGTPTVTTPLGAEGIDLAACGPALRVVSGGWDQFAAAATDAVRREQSPPPPEFIETYDWRFIGERIPI